MSEETAPQQAETQEQVWERTTAPITKEDVRGDAPVEEAPRTPDRELVAPKLKEAIKPAPEPNPLEQRLASIEQALQPEPEPAGPTPVEEEVRQLRELILQKEQEAAEQKAQQEHEAQISVFREGVVSNIRESNDYPAIVALGWEGKVFEALYAQLQQGADVSEDDVASQAEAELRKSYDLLKKAFEPTTSEEATPSEEPKPKPTTLTSGLSGNDSPMSTEELYNSTDRATAMKQVWESLMGT